MTAQKNKGVKVKTYLFKVVLEEDPFEDGRMAYHAYCPVLKGASTWGYSREEALKNIKDAIVGCLESLAEERTRLLGGPGRIVEVTV
jgi:predicted RNase H-like HicB family nuclease